MFMMDSRPISGHSGVPLDPIAYLHQQQLQESELLAMPYFPDMPALIPNNAITSEPISISTSAAFNDEIILAELFPDIDEAQPGFMPEDKIISHQQPIKQQTPQAQTPPQKPESSRKRQRELISISPKSTPSSPDGEKPRCFEHGCQGRAFSSIENYRRHLRERLRLNVASCPYCGAVFSRKSNRDAHVSRQACRVMKWHRAWSEGDVGSPWAGQGMLNVGFDVASVSPTSVVSPWSEEDLVERKPKRRTTDHF